ncbi:hypothetical protein BC941DRAFT_65710 [Chlamydoabsidia padenii]|nr:hypothetical protein BC941DRAFT_65710 [Chlamydoabsidia padenii]
MIQQAKVDDDNEEIMSSIKAQNLIQQLLQPYDINFMEICDYCYWKDPLYNARPDTPPTFMNSRFIALGNVSHDIQPAGWILPDMGFEQAVNLCWKLDLDIRQRSTPKLLETYYDETRIKIKDVSMASDVLLRLLRDPFTITHDGGMAKLLQGHRHCFIGGMLLENNELNMNCPQTRKVQRGSVGTLAPNGRLKPYNLNQLLTQQSNNHHHHQHKGVYIIPDNKKPNHHQSLTSLSSNDSQQGKNNVYKLKFLRGLFTFPNNKKGQEGVVSSMGVTTTATSTISSDKWKGIRANHYQLWDQLSSHSGDTNFSRSTFTILVLCGSLLDSHSLLALRKLKKHLDQPNSFLRMFEYPQHQYLHHQQQRQQTNRSKSTPTESSRSSLPNDTHDTLSSPPIQLKARQPRRSESSSSFYSAHSSISSTDENISNDKHCRDSNSTKLSSHRSSLFTRYSSSSNADRYSMATTISDSSTNHLLPPLPPSVENQQGTASHDDTSMFSFVCLTNSSKSECIQFLSEQTPYSLHQMFPFGLTNTFLDHDQQCHESYAIKDQQQHRPTLVVIRRDGYVGARIPIEDQPLYELNRYFDQILLPVVDFSSAAALVADDYCL